MQSLRRVTDLAAHVDSRTSRPVVCDVVRCWAAVFTRPYRCPGRREQYTRASQNHWSVMGIPTKGKQQPLPDAPQQSHSNHIITAWGIRALWHFLNLVYLNEPESWNHDECVSCHWYLPTLSALIVKRHDLGLKCDRFASSQGHTTRWHNNHQ